MTSLNTARYNYAQQIKRRNRNFKIAVFIMLSLTGIALISFYAHVMIIDKTLTGKLTIYDPYWNVKITIDGEFEIIDGGYFCKSNNTLYYTNNNVIFEVK